MRTERLGEQAANGLRSSLTNVYRQAWAGTGFFPVEEELRGFSDRYQRHTSNPDFRLCVAYEDDRPAGFAYGYTSVPGGWWRQMVTRGLPPESADEWFGDCFEFAELAVVPRYQGRGFGAALHDSLLEDLPHRRAILSTQKHNHRAMDFYLNRKWTVVMNDFFFPNRLYPYVILGMVIREPGS